MRDPHVVSLRYRLETDETISYKNPPPLEVEYDSFSGRLADDVLMIEMKQHFSSISTARSEVEKFLRAWELDVALQFGRLVLRFTFYDADVIDRDPPPPGTPQVIELSGGAYAISGASATLHVAKAQYPKPSPRFHFSPDVETLWQRYQGYRNGHEPLLAMAYFCLTLIEARTGGRKQAARQFSIDKTVLDKLGKITSTRGDTLTARKLDSQSTVQSLTQAEVVWTDTIVKILIRRVAEYDPANPLPLLTMSDLPPA